MQGLLAVLAGLFGIMLIPLALGGGTAWLLIPAHLTFSVFCGVGSLLAGLDGRASRARVFGAGFLLASVLAVVALTVGSAVRDDSWYWIVPWAPALIWSWIPPVLAGVGSALGQHRRGAKTRRVVRRRRRARAEQRP